MTEFLPGTSIPAPPLMTAEEAAIYLRLATPEECQVHAGRAIKRLNRLVAKGLVRPCIVHGKRHYGRDELHRFIISQTDRYSEAQ